MDLKNSNKFDPFYLDLDWILKIPIHDHPWQNQMVETQLKTINMFLILNRKKLLMVIELK